MQHDENEWIRKDVLIPLKYPNDFVFKVALTEDYQFLLKGF